MNPDQTKRHLRLMPETEPRDVPADRAAALLSTLTAPELPESVLEDVDRAARLADDLAAASVQIRYEMSEATGRVVATLCDLDGERLRSIPLAEALGAGDEGSPAA